MSTINDLSVASSFSPDDKLPMWQNANGVTRALPISVLTSAFLTQEDIQLLAISPAVETFVAGTDFTPGTTVALTLANDYGSASNLTVHFDASYQGPENFSLILNTLTFSAPIPVGIEKVYVKGGAVRQENTPADGSVTDASVASGTKLFNRIDDTVSVKDFGAKGDGVTDDTAALAAAVAFVAAQASPPKLIFPAGVYVASAFPNFAIANAVFEAQGECVLQYTGTGNAITLDAGPSPATIFNVDFGGSGRFTVNCPATALNAVFVRSVHHSRIRIKPRGAGPASAGLCVEFAVCTQFDVTASHNEDGGWYQNAMPFAGIFLDQRDPGETASYCTFINPVIEGPTRGIVLNNTLGNIFLGGTSEGSSDYGVYGAPGSNQDRFIGTDFEANGLADVFLQGRAVEFIGCDTFKLVQFGSTSKVCSVIGGLHSDISFDVGSTGNTVLNAKYNRFNDGSTYSDLGSANEAIGVRNGATGFAYLAGAKTFAPGTIANGASVSTVFSVPGARFGYWAVAAYAADLQGVTISAYVSSADNVTAVFSNNTGSSKTLASNPVVVKAFQFGA